MLLCPLTLPPLIDDVDVTLAALPELDPPGTVPI